MNNNKFGKGLYYIMKIRKKLEIIMIKLMLQNLARNQSKIACSTRIRQKYLSTLKATDKDNSTENTISFRNASEREIQSLSRKLISKEKWSIGSHDLMYAYKSFPNAFYVRVQKNEIVLNLTCSNDVSSIFRLYWISVY